MNIGMMQLTNIGKPTVKKSSSPQAHSSNDRFDKVFNSVVGSGNNKSKPNIEAENATNKKQLEELLNTNSLEDALNILGIEHEDGFLFTEDGQAVAMDELMNLEDLLQVLGMDQQNLEELVGQLLGKENLELNNIWDLVSLFNEEAPENLQNLLSALNGEQNVTPKAAQELLHLLKFSQIVGENTDLVGNQEKQVSQLSDLLKLIAQEVGQNTTQQDSKSQLFNRVVNQLLISSERKDETVETVSVQNIGANSNTTNTKTVAIHLPAEKPAQSEALAKEIQNLLNRSQISNTQGTMKLLVKLYPENLGSIRIEILQQDGVLTARLLASTPQAKELLDSQIQQLRSAFNQQNIQMDRIDIAQSIQDPERTRDQNLFGNMFRQQQSNQDEEEIEDNENDEKISFSDYLLNEEV